MLRYPILLLVFFTGLSHAAYVDRTQTKPDLSSWGSSLGNDDYYIARKINDIRSPNWAQLFAKLLPNLKKVGQALQREVNVYNRLEHQLELANKNYNSNDIYVPNKVFNEVISNLKKIEIYIYNILFGDLGHELSDHSQTLEGSNGVVTMPRPLGAKFVKAIDYVAEQFVDIQNAAYSLRKGFFDIYNFIYPTPSGEAPNAYAQIANIAKPAADKLGGVGDVLYKLIRDYKRITKVNSNGDIVITDDALAKATNDGLKNIADEFNQLADYANQFLSRINNN